LGPLMGRDLRALCLLACLRGLSTWLGHSGTGRAKASQLAPNCLLSPASLVMDALVVFPSHDLCQCKSSAHFLQPNPRSSYRLLARNNNVPRHKCCILCEYQYWFLEGWMPQGDLLHRGCRRKVQMKFCWLLLACPSGAIAAEPGQLSRNPYNLNEATLLVA